MSIPLAWFNGSTFSLSGVDLGNDGEASTILFELNGNVYKAKEDPDDGYRSSLDDVEKVTARLKNRFKAVKVIAELQSDHRVDILRFTDVMSEQVILEIGTDRTDDYYPSFVGNWMPEKMHVNRQTAAMDVTYHEFIKQLDEQPAKRRKKKHQRSKHER